LNASRGKNEPGAKKEEQRGEIERSAIAANAVDL